MLLINLAISLFSILKVGALECVSVENTGTHWISLFVKPKYTVYFDSFGVEHTPEEIDKFIGNKKI